MTQAEDFKRALEEMDEIKYPVSDHGLFQFMRFFERNRETLRAALQRAINEPQFHDNEGDGE